MDREPIRAGETGPRAVPQIQKDRVRPSLRSGDDSPSLWPTFLNDSRPVERTREPSTSGQTRPSRPRQERRGLLRGDSGVRSPHGPAFAGLMLVLPHTCLRS
jgi:hypothetical protein